MSENDNGQNGPAVWADAPEVVAPPMRTFRVVMDACIYGSHDVYVDAHSVTCEGDAAKFYTYKGDRVEGTLVLVAYCTRVLRPYLDIEDITGVMAATSTKLN